MNTGGSHPEALFGDVWYDPGGEFGPRRQPDYQLVVVHAGEARVTSDDASFLIPPGSVALLPPGRREYFHFSRRHRTHHTWCSVRPDVPGLPLRRRLARLPPVLPQSRAFGLLMQGAFNILSWREPEGRRLLSALGLALLQEYVRMAREGSGEADRESPRERARRHLQDHFAEADCLAGASRAAGVTPQQVMRLFRRHYGITPGRFLWRMRTESGASLLTASGLTVAEIADRCGFKNPFHFSRLLKKMQGVSPRQLRQRAWMKD